MNDPAVAEVLQHNQALIDQGQALLQQADAVRAERDRLFDQAGISFAAVRDYLQSDALPPDERAAIQAEMARYETELAAEHERLAAEQSSRPTAPRPRGIGTRDMV